MSRNASKKDMIRSEFTAERGVSSPECVGTADGASQIEKERDSAQILGGDASTIKNPHRILGAPESAKDSAKLHPNLN